jgi:hypothetical protein
MLYFLPPHHLCPSNFSFDSTVSKFDGEEKKMFVNGMIK